MTTRAWTMLVIGLFVGGAIVWFSNGFGKLQKKA